MKKQLFSILALFPLALCAQKGGPFTVKVQLGDAPAQKVLFARYTLKTGQHLDTLQPVNGQVTIQGVVDDERQRAQLIVYAQPGSASFQFYLEPGHITVDMRSPMGAFTIAGTPLNKDLNTYNTLFYHFLDTLHSDRKADANFRFTKDVLEKKYAVVRQFVTSHVSSPVSLDMLNDFAHGSKEPDKVQALFNKLSPALRSSASGQELADRIKGLRAVGVGDLAPAFTIPDTEGKPVSLADFKGKYVLVDFWATWCAPCIAELPHLIKARDAYKDKNFDIISISLDRPDSKALWLKKIKEYKMDWTQVSELKWWNGRSALLYNINSVPANFLVDPQGKIIAVNLRGEALNKKLQEIL